MEGQVRRVVVTGLGMINSLGHNKEESFEAIVNGESGIDTITLFNSDKFSVRIAGEVKNFDPLKIMDSKDVKKADRFIQLGIKAAQEAMKDANIDDSIDRDRFGVSCASGIGGLPIIEKNSIILHTRGPRRISSIFYSISLLLDDCLVGFVCNRNIHVKRTKS